MLPAQIQLLQPQQHQGPGPVSREDDSPWEEEAELTRRNFLDQGQIWAIWVVVFSEPRRRTAQGMRLINSHANMVLTA